MTETVKLGRVFPPLPDREFQQVVPAADGRAWLKACVQCAGRTSDPQELGDAYQRDIMAGSSDTAFYCIHRDEDGNDPVYDAVGVALSPVRVCACYAALHPEQAIPLAALEAK
jgi:hypothetical protein